MTVSHLTPDATIAELAKVAARAFEEFDAAKQGVAQQQAQALALTHEEVEIAAKIERMTELEREDAARRLLDGEATAPPKPQRVQRVATLRERRSAIQAALPMMEERIAKAQEAMSDVEASLADAVLRLSIVLRNDAAQRTRLSLADLAPAVAQLKAADQIQQLMVGHSFSFDGLAHADLFSGAHVADALVSALPERLRPPELSEERISADTARIAGEILAMIKGATK